MTKTFHVNNIVTKIGFHIRFNKIKRRHFIKYGPMESKIKSKICKIYLYIRRKGKKECPNKLLENNKNKIFLNRNNTD